jgi:FKBP-type peptidyl-prolyl cis-trans isomerase 2
MKASKGAILFLSILILGSVIFGSGCTDNGKNSGIGNNSSIGNNSEIGNNSSIGNNSGLAESRVVKAGDTVQVDYIGKLENGTVFDTSREDVAKQAGIYVSSRTYAPLTFVAGSGQIIKGFDKGVIGMKVGEEKTIKTTPEEAYGEYDKAKVQAVPIKSLNMTEVPKVGQTLWNQYGMQFKVIAVNDTHVTLDANHELAGKTLIFDVKLISSK